MPHRNILNSSQVPIIEPKEKKMSPKTNKEYAHSANCEVTKPKHCQYCCGVEK